MKKLFLLFAAAGLLAACNNSDNTAAPSSDTGFRPAPDTGSRIIPNTTNDTALGVSALPVSQPEVIPVATQGKEVRLNPAHGAPGHRCDIAVGAPLDGSATTTATAPAITTTPSITAPSVTTPSSGKQVKLNPPHGQPGHDCAVEVGKPLPG